jgi:hypothetical protein
MRRSIAVCWILVVGCTAAVDPLAPGDVGRYWAALRGHGHAQSAQTYWFEWKPQTLDWNWAYQGPHRHAPAGEPPTGDAPLTEWVTGLAPATAYDYRICGIADGETATACTDPGSFTTAAATTLRWVGIDPAAPSRLALDDGSRFVPWGNNYTNANANHVRNTIPEDLMHSDLGTILVDLDKLADVAPPDGRGNVIRLHVQMHRFLVDATAVDPEAFARLARVIEAAEDRGLYVMLCGLGYRYPHDNPLWIAQQDEAARWATQALWWNTMAHALANSPGIFAYDLMNEPSAPSGSIVQDGVAWLGGVAPDQFCAFGNDPATGNHGSCWVQQVTPDAAGRTRIQIAAQWTQRMVGAIRHTSYFPNDTRHLITIGVAGAFLLNNPFFDATVNQYLDFISPHLYPNSADNSTAKIGVAAALSASTGKPVIVGETFYLGGDPHRLISQTCSDGTAQGWIGQFDGRIVGEPCLQPGGCLAFGPALYDAWYQLQAEYGPTITAGGCPARIP